MGLKCGNRALHLHRSQPPIANRQYCWLYQRLKAYPKTKPRPHASEFAGVWLKRRADHAHPIMHPARAPQLTHACIHYGVSGLTLLPGVQIPCIGPPGEPIKFIFERATAHMRVVMQ